jgi:hypothetical protein
MGRLASVSIGFATMAQLVAEYLTDVYRNSPDRDILTPEGCRNLLQVGDKALGKLISAGLPAVPTSNSYRFPRAEVLRWMANEGVRLLSREPDSSSTKTVP